MGACFASGSATDREPHHVRGHDRQIGYKLYVMVFTEGSHENAVRVISLRLAEKHEVRFYYDQV